MKKEYKKGKNPKEITKEMDISQIIQIKPMAVEILMEFGLGCTGCAFSDFESLEQGALSHGISEEIITKMVDEINKI